MEILILLVGAYVFYLSRRIDSLRKEIDKLKSGTVHEVAETQTPLYPPGTFEARVQSSVTQPSPTFMPASYQVPQDSGFDVIAWLQKDFFVKVGAFLLLLACGWFVSYAFANNWVGEAGRIALGVLAGIISMVIGVWRLPKSVHQGSIFTVLGSGIVVMTVFTARNLYDMFTPTSALFVMFLSVAFVAFIAVKARSQALAICGLLIGAAAPLLTNTPEPSVMGLFSYLAVIVVGSLWVMWMIRANALPLIALGLVVLWGAPYMSIGISDDTLLALLWSFGFTALFFLCSLLGLASRSEMKVHAEHLALAGGTGLYVTLWIATAAPEVWQAGLYAIWMVVFSFGAFVMFQKTRDPLPFYIYSGVSLILLAAATAALLSGPLLTIAYIIEVVALIMMATRLPAASGIAYRISYLFVVPLLLSVEHLDSPLWREGRVLHEDFYVLLLLMVSLGFSAMLLLQSKQPALSDGVPVPGILSVIAGIYGLLLVWLVSHSVFSDDQAVLVSLVLYTLGGIGLYIQGVSSENKTIKMCGSVLIGFVVGRLLLIDVWDMALAGRIITFFVVGVLLMSTAFMRKFNQK